MSPIETLVFHHLTKAGAAVFLILLWISFFRTTLKGWWKVRKDMAFPAVSCVLMLALTCGFFYYVSMEQAFRQVPAVNSGSMKEKQREQIIRDSEFELGVHESRSETLDEKTARMLRENREQNINAKEEFLKGKDD